MTAQFLFGSVRSKNRHICQKVKDDLGTLGQWVSCCGVRLCLTLGGDSDHLLGGFTDGLV